MLTTGAVARLRRPAAPDGAAPAQRAHDQPGKEKDNSREGQRDEQRAWGYVARHADEIDHPEEQHRVNTCNQNVKRDNRKNEKDFLHF